MNYGVTIAVIIGAFLFGFFLLPSPERWRADADQKEFEVYMQKCICANGTLLRVYSERNAQVFGCYKVEELRL